MKFLTKRAIFGFGVDKEPAAPKPFKTYKQTVESLPSYALKRRLTKLRGQAGTGTSTMREDVKKSYNAKVYPIIEELRARGENV